MPMSPWCTRVKSIKNDNADYEKIRNDQELSTHSHSTVLRRCVYYRIEICTFIIFLVQKSICKVYHSWKNYYDLAIEYN